MPAGFPYIQHWDPDKIEKTFSGSIRSYTSYIALRREEVAAPVYGANRYVYPTSGVHYVRYPSFAPLVRRTWDFLDLVTVLPVDDDGNEVGSVLYRVHDGTTSKWWNGAAWVDVVDEDTDWNTLVDFNANLRTLDIDSFALEVRLQTSDPEQTPQIGVARLVWTGAETDVLGSWIYDTIVPSLRDNVRVLVEQPFTADGTDTIALASVDVGQLDVVQIAHVYAASDRYRKVDLKSAADGEGTGVVLDPVPAAGTKLMLELLVRPDVAVTTDDDWPKQASAPAIWLLSVASRHEGTRSIGVRGPGAVDRSLAVPAGVVYPNPVQTRDLLISYVVHAHRGRVLSRLVDAVNSWITTHPVIVNPLTGERSDLEVESWLTWNTDHTNFGDPRMASGSFTLTRVSWYTSDRRGAASGDATAPSTPVRAGDPAHPGVGYGANRLRTTWGTPTAPSETPD